MSKKQIHLAKNLNFLAETRNLTVSNIANQVDMNTSTLHNYFNGVVPRNIIALKRIADLFEVTIDELIFSSKPERVKKSEMEVLSSKFEIIIKQVN